MTQSPSDSAPDKLRALLAGDGIITMPCCFDPLSAKLIAQEGFPLTFMSGFARAGFAAVMIEDQLAPKRCGHTAGKAVVQRDEACERIRAAVDARGDDDILILARTDARHDRGLDEAIERARMFHDLGADILFVEAPRDKTEMARICDELEGPKMANLLEGEMTPNLPPSVLQDMGFKIAAYPLTLLSAAMKAMTCALQDFRAGGVAPDRLMSFEEIRTRIGFDDYFAAEQRYSDDR